MTMTTYLRDPGVLAAGRLGLDGSRFRLIAQEGLYICLRERVTLPGGGEDPMARTVWTTAAVARELDREAAMQTRVAVLAYCPAWGENSGDTESFVAMESISHADEEEVPYAHLRVGESWAEAAERAAWKARVRVEVSDVTPLIDALVPLEADGQRTERRLILAGRVLGRLSSEYVRRGTVEQIARGAFGSFLARAESALLARRNAR